MAVTTLVEVPCVQGPCIVLENLVRDNSQHGSHGLHVVSLADSKMMKFGRGHESDVRIADVSISRKHASIRFEDGHFIIEDQNSKFGTLIATKKPKPISSTSPTSIQVGRTVLNFAMHASLPMVGADSSSGEAPSAE